MTRHIVVVLAVLTIAVATSATATAQSTGQFAEPKFTVLHAFAGGADGQAPFSGLIIDKQGNFYGTTLLGGSGASPLCLSSGGCGTIYKIDPVGNLTILYGFQGSNDDGAYPYGALLRDSAGNLYGATSGGGTSGRQACSGYGCGTVFTLSATGRERVVYNFTGGVDGATPKANLALGADGRVYSTTWIGGVYNWGVVYAVDKHGIQTVIHDFDGANHDGGEAAGGLVRDDTGTFYGLTLGGDDLSCWPGFQIGCGTLYQVTEAGDEKVLYAFTGGQDGSWPSGNLVRDTAGNLYGTSQGGPYNTGILGAVFKLDTAGNFTVLHEFTGGVAGEDPYAGLTRDAAGNLYGTTIGGGGTACPPNGCGTVFVLEPSGKFTILHSFTGGQDGWAPNAPLTLDPSGNLFGIATDGGAFNEGVVFKISR